VICSKQSCAWSDYCGEDDREACRKSRIHPVQITLNRGYASKHWRSLFVGIADPVSSIRIDASIEFICVLKALFISIGIHGRSHSQDNVIASVLGRL
jgi:hypothetical protein